jgi:hypothetical protein
MTLELYRSVQGVKVPMIHIRSRSMRLFILSRVTCLLIFGLWSVRGLGQEPPTSVSLRVADVAELHRTLQQVRQLRTDGFADPVTVELAGGAYHFVETLRLTPDVIGRGLTLKAEEPGKVIFSGGRQLTAEPRDADGNWRFQLGEDWQENGIPRVLIINGQLHSAARHPSEGDLRIERAFDDRRSGFFVQEGDLPEGLNVESGVCDLILLHDWSSSRLPVASYDPRTRELRTVGPIGCEAPHYAIDHFEKQPRYWLEGHPLFATEPGEWFVDREAGQIVVRGGQEEAPPDVTLPWLTEILIASGTDEAPIRNLALEGITFTGSRFPMPSGGLAGAQATMHEPRDADGQRTTRHRPMLAAAVIIENAVGCRVNNCRFEALGGTGLWIAGRTRDCRVFRSRFDDLGGNGLNLGEDNSRHVEGRPWHQSAPDQVPTGNRVEQCRISHCGQVLPGAVAVWAPLNRRLEIVDNHIHDCPYTGISLGWIWNDSPSPAGENVIRGNRIEFVMQTLSDGGGIYTLGRQPESVIEENHISDVPLNLGRAESNGMFLDEGTAGFTIRSNTIRRIDRSPLRFHRASENIVRNNRWELAAPDIPPVRYNNTPQENISLQANEPLEPEQRVFLIGNSLTWDTVPSRLDGNVHWHVDCGKSLKFIHESPESPCVQTSRLWPLALRTAQYDMISVQPHYGTTLEEDEEVISAWLKLQPRAVFVIHTGWARHATLREEFADADPAGPLTHSPAYFNELLRRLRQSHPDRQFRSTRAMELLYRIADDIDAGQAPLASIEDLYRDNIHMTTDAGRYLMHNAMRTALGQPLTSEGFAEFDPQLKAYLDGLLSSLIQGKKEHHE